MVKVLRLSLQVEIAVANDIPFLTLGGGHGTTDYTSFNGIAIDLGNFKTVQVDAANNRLTIGGATEYSQLSGPLYDAGKELRMILRSFDC
jgi:fumiquinazoline A oxidase